MLRNGVEKLAFPDFAKLLTCATSELRNRPAVGLSIWAGAMQATAPLLRAGVEQGILGEGLEFFLQKLDPLMAQLALVNTYGDGGLLRTHESLTAAIGDIFKTMKQLNQTDGVQAAVMQIFKTGTALVHFAYQLVDVLSAVKSFEEWGQGIGRPRDQPEPGALATWRQAEGQKAARKAAEAYFAVALSTRATKKRRTSEAAGPVVDLRQLGE